MKKKNNMQNNKYILRKNNRKMIIEKFKEKIISKTINIDYLINKENNLNSYIISSYLAGLFEGNGCIWFPNLNKKKQLNPRFCLKFSLKNKNLVEKLIRLIGYGVVLSRPNSNSCLLVINTVKGLKKIIKYINGELRTPKINQLYRLIDWLNYNHNSNIPKLPLKEKDLFEDSWFAGYIDVNGSFSIQHTVSENNEKISCKLKIEELTYDPITKLSYINILTNIAKFLDCNLKRRKQVSTGYEYFNITASSRKSLIKIISYFNKFPLWTSKSLEYKDWKKAVILILKNLHYTDEGINRIDFLKKNMNLKRSIFT